MTQALTGLRVLELANFVAGPYCAMNLADHGADVIKIERPGTGDENRTEPPFIKGESAPFMLWNRNKRSVCLDLKAKEGRERFLELAKDADVLIENFRPGVMSRLGFGYEHLSKRNPRLIYGSISGYGRTGPLAQKGGFDLVMQGFTGLMALTGPEDQGPHRMPVPLCDIAAGMHLCIGILCALQARERTGRGQYVETSLFDAGLALQLYEAATVFATGAAPKKLGQKHRGVAPYQAVKTKDGHITIGAAQQSTWERLCEVLDRKDLVAHPDYRTNAERVANADKLVRELESSLARYDASHWLEKLEQAGVPCGAILTTDQALYHEQSKDRGMVAAVDHSSVGRSFTLGVPVKLSETPGAVSRPAPMLGEHSDEPRWRSIERRSAEFVTD